MAKHGYEGRLWNSPDVFNNAIASADWQGAHPGLCYEIGDQNFEHIIPRELLLQIFTMKHLAVGIWQPDAITVMELNHTPQRSLAIGYMRGVRPETDSCVVQRYAYAHSENGIKSVEPAEIYDPLSVCRSLILALDSPLGSPLPFNQNLLLAAPIQRVVFEFPDYAEGRNLPRDTSMGALALLASKEYVEVTR